MMTPNSIKMLPLTRTSPGPSPIHSNPLFGSNFWVVQYGILPVNPMFVGPFPYIVAIYSQIKVMAKTWQENHYPQYVYIPLKRVIGLFRVKRPNLFNQFHIW